MNSSLPTGPEKKGVGGRGTAHVEALRWEGRKGGCLHRVHVEAWQGSELIRDAPTRKRDGAASEAPPHDGFYLGGFYGESHREPLKGRNQTTFALEKDPCVHSREKHSEQGGWRREAVGRQESMVA